MSHPSRSNETNDEPRQPHPWLQKHYQEKRERTVRLVKATVDQLQSDGQTVTIEAICRRSLECDPEHRGVKKSAILENPEAHAYYRQHSTSYKTAQARKRKGHPIVSAAQPLRIDSNRNVERTRYRYMQMTKPQIIERLLMVEQAYAELEQQQTRLQFELFELKLPRTEVKREK
jgi:hypothetical protein